MSFDDYVSSFICLFFFFKQKTAYEMRISDWSSDVCSSDLSEGRRVYDLVDELFDHGKVHEAVVVQRYAVPVLYDLITAARSQSVRDQYDRQIGRASCRERVCQYV